MSWHTIYFISYQQFLLCISFYPTVVDWQCYTSSVGLVKVSLLLTVRQESLELWIFCSLLHRGIKMLIICYLSTILSWFCWLLVPVNQDIFWWILKRVAFWNLLLMIIGSESHIVAFYKSVIGLFAIRMVATYLWWGMLSDVEGWVRVIHFWKTRP